MFELQTDADTYVPWSARMALRLLQHKSLCLKADPDDAIMCPWVAALPRQVFLRQLVTMWNVTISLRHMPELHS